jgi:arylsulfatase
LEAGALLGNDDGELYNLRADPGEHVNLWDDPAHAAKQAELLDVLRDWLIRSPIKAGNWSEDFR